MFAEGGRSGGKGSGGSEVGRGSGSAGDDVSRDQTGDAFSVNEVKQTQRKRRHELTSTLSENGNREPRTL